MLAYRFLGLTGSHPTGHPPPLALPSRAAAGFLPGRPTKLNAKQRKIIAKRYAVGETAAALAREFEVGEATIWRALNPAAE